MQIPLIALLIPIQLLLLVELADIAVAQAVLITVMEPPVVQEWCVMVREVVLHQSAIHQVPRIALMSGVIVVLAVLVMLFMEPMVITLVVYLQGE